MSRLRCEQLCVGYEGRILVRDIHFCLEEGRSLLLLGKNGAGKSTLIKTLLSLIKPISGTFCFSSSPQAAGAGPAYLSQEQKVRRDFPATVEEMLRASLVAGRGGFFFGRRDRRRLEECVADLALEALRKRRFSELSGGQKQLVRLARALCLGRDFFIFDEALAQLDAEAKRDFYRVLSELRSKGEIGFLMVSHELDGLEKLCDDLLFLGDGRQCFFRPVTEEEKRGGLRFAPLLREAEEACSLFVGKSD